MSILINQSIGRQVNRSRKCLENYFRGTILYYIVLSFRPKPIAFSIFFNVLNEAFELFLYLYLEYHLGHQNYKSLHIFLEINKKSLTISDKSPLNLP